MRNVFEEYRQGIITWDEAYRIANNNAAIVSGTISNTSSEETDYWCCQMESLGVDIAEQIMLRLGYWQDADGILHKAS